jgi:hypothetical protein
MECILAGAVKDMADKTAVIDWLLAGDPSIRWQVMHDLTHESDEVVAAERSRVASEGWGARLLDSQTPEGHWSDDQDHGWMTTNDVLTLLRQLGVPPEDERVRNVIGRVVDGIKWWQLDGRPFFDGETEPCINGRILASGAYFGADVEKTLARLLGEQLEDGGWNCEAPPSKRSSFHSTICVLDGLLAYETARGPKPEVTEARIRGQNYLLERRMLRSLTSGDIINSRWAQLSFPPTWHYDVLRGLDYLRSAGVTPHERLSEAIALVENARDANGRWPQDVRHSDERIQIPVDVETEVGAANRWNTLRALRVLDWYRSAPA